MKKKRLALVSILIMVVAMTACGTNGAGNPETVTASGGDGDKKQLIMGTNAEFPPYEFHEGGKIVGIDVEIAGAIAEELGMELVIEDMNFDSVIPAIQSGKVNVGLAGMTILPDRLENVNFSTPYAAATQVVIVKEGSTEVTSLEDLDGKAVGVQLGTTGDIYSSDIKDVKIERYSKGFEAIQALLQGKVDAVIIDREPAKFFVKENTGLTILNEPFAEEEYAIAVSKKDTELLENINKALEKLAASGKIQEIVDKYIKAE